MEIDCPTESVVAHDGAATARERPLPRGRGSKQFQSSAKPDWRTTTHTVDVTRLPFNALIGLEPASPESGCLVYLPADPKYANHLGTVHASALLAVAEAGSGAALI